MTDDGRSIAQVVTAKGEYQITSYNTLSLRKCIFEVSDPLGFHTRHSVDFNELDHYDFDYLITLHENERRRHASFRHIGPSNEELSNNPALKSAWEAYLIVKKLCGV